MNTNRHEATVDTFFALIRAGLWKNCDEFHVSGFKFQDVVDWEEVYQLAGEQMVVGLVTAGIDRLKNANINLNLDLELLLQMIGEVQIIEQTNKEMNKFIEKLVEEMCQADIYTLLVKGQGIAQCYER